MTDVHDVGIADLTDLCQTPAVLDALYRYADPRSFCALRVFPHARGQPPPWAADVKVGDTPGLIAAIARGVRYAATSTAPTVFCATTSCTFRHPGTAKTRDIAEGLALAVELDDGDTAVALARLEMLIGAPTLVVRSGSFWADPETGELYPKRHAYWRLSEAVTDEAALTLLYAARRNAAFLTGADPTGAALAHCYRWPGSLNRKHPDHPALCTVERINSDAEIHLADAAELLADAVEGAGLDRGAEYNGNSRYQRQRELQADPVLVAEAMATIPNPDALYNEWVRMAYAVVGATGGTGYDIFNTWSRQSSKHDDGETEALWDRVLAAGVTHIGAGTIFHEARQHGGWIDPRQHKPKTTAAEAVARKDATNEPVAGHTAAQTPDPTRSDADGGSGNGKPPPPPGGPDGGGSELDYKPEPDGDVPLGTGAEPADAILHAIDQLGPGLTREALTAMFNKRYAVANEGGKALVMWTAFDPVLARDRIERASFDDFKKFYCNRKLTVTSITEGKPKIVTKNFAEWWLEEPKRRQYLSGVVFAPGAGAIPHTLNLWRGWAIEPAPGDWSLMSAHIHDVICSGRTDISSYVLRWLAYMVQHPDRPGEVAIVVRGLKGVGKGILGKWLLRLCGQHGLHIINATHLTGRFAGHLNDVVFVLADEAFYAGDKQHEGVLKGIITESQLLIEAKYRTPVQVANMLHLMMFSNNDWVVPATHDERRYLMLDAAATYKGDFAYFAALDDQMENGGLAAMLHELANMDLGDFHPRKVPDTPELGEQKLHSLASHHRWWMAVLSRGFVWRSRYGHEDFLCWDEFVTTELLNRSYMQWCQDNRITYPAPRVVICKMLAAIYPPGRPRGQRPVYEADSVDPHNPQPVVKLANQHGYKVGPLPDARTLFRDSIGIEAETSEWDTPVTED